MKKIYSLVGALLICGVVFAQPTDDKTKKDGKKPVKTVAVTKVDKSKIAKSPVKPINVAKATKENPKK